MKRRSPGGWPVCSKAGETPHQDAPTSKRPRLLLVSPRPPRPDGQGDQRRAHDALTGLTSDWEVEVASWLPDVDRPPTGRWLARPVATLRALALAAVRPASVAYFQSLAPRALTRRIKHFDITLFITDRAVPFSVHGRYAIDFIDDLGGAAARRAQASVGVRSLFWRWESRRLRRYDASLAAGASLSFAVNNCDAAAIAPSVQTIPLAIGTRPRPDTGDRILFCGNLFYAPNVEAATWMCTELAPRLAALGMDSRRIVIAGRRPPASLRAVAAGAAVDLRADVPDLADVLTEAAVVVAPVVMGSGVQSKVLDAVGMGRACVVTPFVNQVLDLVDGQSALVRERTAEAFADGILMLFGDRQLRERLVQRATEQFACYKTEAVSQAWQGRFRAVHPQFADRAGHGSLADP